MIDIENIEVLARTATPGPWFFSPMTETVDPEIGAANGSRVATLAAADITKANCAYIAAANPAAVLALIKELKSNTRMFMAACDELGAVNEKLGLDPNDGGAEPILIAIEELQAVARASATLPPQEPESMDTEQSREYLVQFMEKHFSDTTFHRYIRAEGGSNALAGDFAWQLARALRMHSCQEQHVPAPAEHLSTVLEQAANLAIKLTAAPRDYLGPASSVMKMQAAVGEKIAKAIRALSVPLPTAAQAPQPMTASTTAADMRVARIRSALARLLASDPTTAACSDDELSAAVNDANAPPFVREQAAAMLEARDALAATPVQSPVAEFMGMAWSEEKGAYYPILSSLKFTNVPARTNLYADQVLFVAAPDGWCQFIDGVKTQNVARDTKELDTIKNIFKTMAPIGAKAEYRPFYFAAPAAQGDAKDDEREFSPTEEQFKEWCERHNMQENVSREAFDDATSLYLLPGAAFAASKAAS
jgi:hypothetical protein